jgi:hypothetical protein
LPNIGTAPRISVGRFSIAKLVTDVSVIADERTAELRPIGERIVLSAVTAVFAAAAASSTFNALAVRHYHSVCPAQGNLYTLDGNKMHRYCARDSAPTIVLDVDLGMICSFGQTYNPP